MKRILKIIGIVLSVLIIFIIGMGMLYWITFNTNFWLKYPNPLKTQVAFVKLEFSSYDKLCHEDCMFERNSLRKMIADYLVKEPPAMSAQIKDYLFDNKVIDDFKRELIMAAREGEEIKKERNNDYEIKAPDYLVEYLNTANSSQEIRRCIMANFSTKIGLNADFTDGLFEVIQDENKSADERADAMFNLRSIISEEEEGSAELENGPFPKYRNIKYKEICETLISIAENTNDQYLKHEAIDNLYGCYKFKQYYTPELFSRLEEIFYQENIHAGVQDEILTALYIYEDINKEKVIELMKKIYNNESINKFLRSLAARNLKKMGISGYPELDISFDDWNNSYINLNNFYK